MEVNAPDHQERLPTSDGVELALFGWDPEGGAGPRGVVHVVHGMAEHGLRYGRFARALGAAGYVVYAHDHRGHGQTAGDPAELGYFADEGGWRKAVEDMHRVNRELAARHPELPVAMFAHSMGSMMAQDYMFTFGDTLAAIVLSGTQGGVGLMVKVGGTLARVERARVGARTSSPVLQAAAFGAYNKRFEPRRTEYDWLSADTEEVDKYVADPRCGFPLTTQGWCDVFHGIGRIESLDNQARVPKTLPVHLVAGELDPVGAETKGVRWLIDRYQRVGLGRVSHRFYAEGRHELLNDVMRDQVTADVIGFLDAALAQR